MGKNLETHSLLKLSHEKIENIKRLITGKEIESIIKTLFKRKAKEQMTSLLNSIKHLSNEHHPPQTLPKN